MDTKEMPTVDDSLAALSDAMGHAADDLCTARAAIDKARTDIASRNTSVSRDIVRDAERVIEHLRKADECVRDVVKDLAER